MSAMFPADRVTIVGVLNVTPDSFSDGGRFVGDAGQVDVAAALRDAEAMVTAGAHVIDVGGESTRPGSAGVSAQTEIARVGPVVEAVVEALAVPVSIDTRKAAVAECALDAGATAINDISGLAADPALARLAAERGAHLILGHLRGEPVTMQQGVSFDDVVDEVRDELAVSVLAALRAGVPRERLCVDPGIGFGKELRHNLALLAQPGRLRDGLGLPVLVGPSRKSFLGTLTGDPASERDTATHAACAVAIFAGADAVRVHDVAGARRVAAVARALREASGERPLAEGRAA